MSDRESSAERLEPVFVHNRDGNTLARAITTHLATLRRDGQTSAELCVASCYFNPQGLDLIASEALHVPHIRLLLGAERTPEALRPRRTPYDPTEPEFTLRLAWEREFPTRGEKTRYLVEEVERIGAEPFHSPDPLPPIAEEEIHLITSMAIATENQETATN